MTKKKRKRQDPFASVSEDDLIALGRGAVRNVVAMSRRQRYEGARVRVRLDVPGQVKSALAEVAEELGTSSSQLGAALLAWALARYQAGEEDLHRALAQALYVDPHPRVDRSLDLTDLLDALSSAMKKGVRPLETED